MDQRGGCYSNAESGFLCFCFVFFGYQISRDLKIDNVDDGLRKWV